MTRDDLVAFTSSVAEEFNTGKIPYPVHLSDGNEDHLIAIFRDVGVDDWIFGSWRLHYHALLKGVPPEVLRDAIRRGESMALRFPEQRVYGSAIVGGTASIAVGVALAVKHLGGNARVWCFLGDMAAETGIVHECMKYGFRHRLPIRWVIEDNGVSVCTPTPDVWGAVTAWPRDVVHYRYRSRYPHAGAGKRVQF